jgi:hypothetical protein
MKSTTTEPSNDLRHEGSDQMAPAGPEEGSRRAYFMVREILCRCEEFERELSERPGAYAGADNEPDRERAMKILSVGLVQLAALECGSGQMRGWAMEFFVTAFSILDQSYPSPSAEDLIAELGSYKPDVLEKHIATRVSRALGSNRAITDRVMTKFIAAQKGTLRDLVLTSLTMPMLALRDLVQLFDASGLGLS